MTRQLLFALMFGWAAFVAANSLQAAEPAPSPAETQSLLKVGKNDRILGNPNAPITIIEYASMTCPHCAHFADTVLPELKRNGLTPVKPSWCCAIFRWMARRCTPR